MILNWNFIWGIFRLEFFTILLNKAILNDLLAILHAFPPPLFPLLKKYLATDAPPALSCHHSSVLFTYIPTASFHFADPFFEWHIPPTTTDSFVYHSPFSSYPHFSIKLSCPKRHWPWWGQRHAWSCWTLGAWKNSSFLLLISTIFRWIAGWKQW